MDLLAMRPSDWRKLSERPVDDGLIDDLLAAIRTVLKTDRHSASLFREDIYLVAVEISNAGLWDRLPAEALADILSRSASGTTFALLEGMPSSYRQRLLSISSATALSA